MKRLMVLILTILSFGIAKAEAGKILNEHLPEWINVDLQFRHRFEYQDNLDFNDSADDQMGFHLYRTRLNVALKPIDRWKLFTQLQDARISQGDFDSKTSYENYMDTRQLYLEANDLYSAEEIGLKGVGFRAGRQELAYGAQRLVGGFNWSNVAQTFDAGKIMLIFDPGKLDIDFFGGAKTANNSPREADDLYDGSSKDILRGYYATYKGFEQATVENYLFNRKTDKNISFGPSGSREIEEYTFGGRIKGKTSDKRWDYELEAAKQWGEFGAFDVDALMAVLVLGYTVDFQWQPRLAFEFDYASGDHDASDTDRETFDNLYPTNHIHYGYMDRVSLQNLNDYRLQFGVKPTSKLDLQTDLHLIYLDTAKDSLYNAGRGVTRTAAASDVNTHVGNELDLLAQYKMCEYADFLAGYSHFFAGKYLEETGAADDGDFFYVQTTLNF